MYYDVYLLKYPKSYYGIKFVKPDCRLIFNDVSAISATKIGRVSEETPLKDLGFILDWQFHGDAQQSMIFGKTKRLEHLVEEPGYYTCNCTGECCSLKRDDGCNILKVIEEK